MLKKKKKTDDKGMIKDQEKCPWIRKEDMNEMFLNSWNMMHYAMWLQLSAAVLLSGLKNT